MPILVSMLKRGVQARQKSSSAIGAKLRRLKQEVSENPRQRVTGKTGLAVVNDPIPILFEKYQRLQEALKSLPKESVYRKATEAFVYEKLQILENSKDLALEIIEQKLDGELLIEEIIQEAQDELDLINRMAQDKP